MKKRFSAIVAVLILATLVLSACSLPDLKAYMPQSQVEAPAAAAQPKAVVTQVESKAAVTNSQTTNQSGPLAESDVLNAIQDRLTQIYSQVNPSVVNIDVVIQGTSTGQQFPGMPSIPGFPNMPSDPSQPGQGYTQQAMASGFVWDKEGDIVTNNHVVENATEVNVTFYDGTTAPAEVVGTDPNSDLAVIKVDVPADQLRPVSMADSTGVNVGQLAVAIGNPFGLEGTMTVGFVSAVGRSMSAESISQTGLSYSNPDIIQTDAPINPGNSGGVLVNDQGQVIGVPTAIESTSGTSAGIGFAVPSATVQRVVPALIDKGSVSYAWLGITGMTLNSDLANAMDLDASQRGVLVIEAAAGGPAEDAGLQGSNRQVDINGQTAQVGGDVIVAIEGEPVKDFEDLAAYLNQYTAPGDRISLTILRNGREQTVDVKLGTRPGTQEPAASTRPGRATPAPETGQAAGAWLGIQGLDLTPAIAQAIDLSRNQEGVLVIAVTPGSPADDADLRGGYKSVTVDGQDIQTGGDVIVAIDGQSVTGLDGLKAYLAEAEPGQRVTLTVLRNGDEIDLKVTLGERPATNP
jgi:serine protease Do